MKKLLLLTFLLCGMSIGLSAKTLVAYYSYTNNVRTIVNELKTQIQADVVEIQPAEEGLDYAANNYALGTQLLNTIKANPNDASSYPAIKSVNVDLSQYSDIIVATPLWWSQMAAPMQTFLFSNGAAMAGKNIWMIVSSASSGISGVITDAKRLIPSGVFSGTSCWIKASQVSQAATMLNTWLFKNNLTTAISDKKIVVVSDPHVMAPGLLLNEGTAWTNYLDGQRKLVDYSKPLFDEMIRRIKEVIQPELVLITGDLTKDGEQLSHQYVISKLNELQTEGIKTLVIPGNHDRGSNSDAVYYNGESTSPADVATNDWFATQYVNYGYGTSSERETSTLTYACEPITGLVVIGVDSGTDGAVSTTTLNWVVEKATAARNNGKKVIAMMHHPLIPHFTGVDNFVETAVVVDYETVRNALADAGVKVVFTGHFHTSDIAMDKNADLSCEIYDVNTGSLISYPCDYREVTLSNNLSELSITTGHIADVLPKRINVTDGTHSVTFELNETSAAQSLYGMLPISKEVQNYSTNEKIFYPETTVSYDSDCIEDDCPAGTLALFSPWGNVVMYYGAASKYTGLYVLGHAVEGEDQISELTGNITVTQVGVAEDRLRTAVKNAISTKGAAYSMIAPTAAEAFIIHAEGNEPDNASAATLLSQLESAANMGVTLKLIDTDKAQALKDMANSMLQDKSQYGVDGRENVANDLTLNIELPVITSLTANEGETGEYWTTYYDGAKSCIADANTIVYTGKVSGDKIALTEIVDKTIPAGNAVILKSTATDVMLTMTTATGTLANNDLKGVDVTTAKTDVYCLNKSGTTVGFYKYSGYVPAHRAYIESISGVRMLSLGDGDATGIVSMEDGRGLKDDRTDKWYSLDGRQFNSQPTRKGIYVKDGKKVVIK